MTFPPSNLLINILTTADIGDEGNISRVDRGIRAFTRYTPRWPENVSRALSEFEFIMTPNRYLI